jgi:hypothetical protein
VQRGRLVPVTHEFGARPTGQPQGRDGIAPPGWPAAVPPPGVTGWDRRAVTWLLDQCPPEFRGYELLHRQPSVLARMAAEQVGAAAGACRRGLATCRADLHGVVPPGVVDETIVLYEREADRLARVERALRLVEAALQGRRFVPRL